MKKHSTKRALLFSALAMILCLSMLVGSTFAWFTDSVVSANNKIKAGTLDVQLLMYNGTEYVDISETSAPIFGVGSIAQNNNAETLWEPGKTQVAYLAIKNNGSLALKYQVGLNVVNVSKDLYKVMQYTITPDAQQGAVTAWNAAAAQSVVVGTQVAAKDVSLAVGATHYFALSIHMMEEAGNEYQAGEVNFDLAVLATQDTVEADSFGTDYDKDATYPQTSFGSATVVPGQSWYEIDLRKADGGKVGSALVPAEAVADSAEAINITVTPSTPYSGVTVTADQKAQGFDITATGLVSGTFAKPVRVVLNVGADLTGVVVYHYDEKLTSQAYDPNKGVVEFETDSFSPFTVVYDAVAQEQPQPSFPAGMPVAVVTDQDQFENTKIEWSSFGPFAALPETDTLESVYKFACPVATEESEKYANWYCDFYVMMESDAGATIPEGALTLGGNYGDFGWVGFKNPEVDGNTYIPLLGSALGNDPANPATMTYSEVQSFVGEFLCGVNHNDHSLDGKTFTVALRMTNPENPSEYYDVNVVEYTFPTCP